MTAKFHISLFLFICILYADLFAQDTIRVMQYNLLYYGVQTDFCTESNNNTDGKDGYLKTILKHLNPHIFAVNEMGQGAENISRLKDNALNVNGIDYYAHTSYTNSTNSWIVNALYYDTRMFGLYREAVPNTTLRDINLYTLFFKSADLEVTGDTTFLTCIVAHLKAGSTSSDQQTRTTMVNNVMNYLQANNYSGNILFMGDFNMQSSYEQAYQTMVNNPNPNIRLNDPIKINGVWGSNADMAPYHTQSTRTGSHPCFVTGGLDDRYDFILASNALMSGTDKFKYIEGSYTTVGQDGNRYNQLLTNPPNYSQPPEVINALHNMSDHLPVTLNLVTLGMTADAEPDLKYSFPEIVVVNPVSESLRIHFNHNLTEDLEISIYSLTGQLMLGFHLKEKPGTENIEFDVSKLIPGIYVLLIRGSDGFRYSHKIVKI